VEKEMKKMSSWGRLNAAPHEVYAFTDSSSVHSILKAHSPGIAYGMGRSYGDVCLNPYGKLWSTRFLDKFIHFNPETGRLICQSGVLLKEIQDLVIPHGWSLAVTPGTLFVTLGGAIANDVHGKNHQHHGTFGEQVRWMRLVRSDGQVLECGPTLESAWFAATVGGVGLTGVILEAEIQLRRIQTPWLDTEMIPFGSLEEFYALTSASEAWEYTVSWIDCLRAGRGLFKRANWSQQQGKVPPKSMGFNIPFTLPTSFVNRATLSTINLAYYHLQKRKSGAALTHYESFLYPLDGISQWNRLYGSAGFYQYQVLLELSESQAALQDMLLEIKRANQGSCLAVLKSFVARPSVGMMSFVKPGITLALDFANRGSSTLKLFSRLDEIAKQAQGRLYLAKDARMPADFFEASYPNLNTFMKYRDLNMSSGLSRRLGMG
jgi:FAD/FMN-containing dehydrogenase